MARGEMRQARTFRRRGLTLGVSVPAVASMGALPAFASHSDMEDLDDGLEVQPETFADVFGSDAEPIDADDPDPEESGKYEEMYDPVEDGDTPGLFRDQM